MCIPCLFYSSSLVYGTDVCVQEYCRHGRLARLSTRRPLIAQQPQKKCSSSSGSTKKKGRFVVSPCCVQSLMYKFAYTSREEETATQPYGNLFPGFERNWELIIIATFPAGWAPPTVPDIHSSCETAAVGSRKIVSALMATTNWRR